MSAPVAPNPAQEEAERLLNEGFAAQAEASRVKGLAEILDELTAAIREYVHLTTPEQGWTIALWVAHTYVMDQMDSTPRLGIKAPTRQSGKTRLLEVVRPVVKDGWHVEGPSAATLYRNIEKKQPTILFDEADRYFEKRAEEKADVVQVLNAGYRRGVSVPRVVGTGTKQEVMDFPVYAAVALAGIAKNWPDTILDRSIVITLQRKKKSEPTARYRAAGIRRMEELGSRLQRTMALVTDPLNVEQADLPTELDDRAQDSWEGLLAIAERAGGEWPERARTAAIALSSRGIDTEDDRLEIVALRDMRQVFTNYDDPSHLSTTTIVEEMRNIAESPWTDEKYPLNAHRLGKHMRLFGIKSRQQHRGDARGYFRVDIEDQWERIGQTDDTPNG